MGTRSDIIVECSDGKFRRVYCHWGGYLEHNGRLLFDHYTSQAKCEALVALGDLSSLRAEIGVKHPFEAPSRFVKNSSRETAAYKRHAALYGEHCTAYGRDRGEKDTVAKAGDTIQAVWPEENTWTEFTYVWRKEPGKWFVCSADDGSQALVDLGDALLGRVNLNANVKVPFLGAIIGKHKTPTPAKMPTLDTFSKGKS